MKIQGRIEIKCQECSDILYFDQPYKYHAGFSNIGFLYNEDGNLTLLWNTHDQIYLHLAEKKLPWTLNSDEQTKIEERLISAPHGGKWRFCNPPRCTKCKSPIGKPINEDVYYFVYTDSVDLSEDGKSFASVVK